ncbi:hypothetical protein V7S43_002048 [Phytophthora oleae]|uniref:Protein kinase domain-containing protein n=1 Tax=Phytophthora oleae TaxID=2107226 RepID=A0ABD3G279_9STRA
MHRDIRWPNVIRRCDRTVAEQKAFADRMMKKVPLARPTAEEALRDLVELEKAAIKKEEMKKILWEKEKEEEDETLETPSRKKNKSAPA